MRKTAIGSVTLALALACGGPAPQTPAPTQAVAPPQAVTEPAWSARLAFAGDARGFDAKALIWPNDAGWGAYYGFDPLGDALRFVFAAPTEVGSVEITPCGVTGPADVTVYADGVRTAGVKLESSVATAQVGREVRRLVLALEGPTASPLVCVSKVRFLDAAGQDLRIGPPHDAEGRVSASRTLSPEDAYAPQLAFDGRLEYAWVEGGEGLGAGEWVAVATKETVTLTAVEIWNGYQRSADHWRRNARAATVGLSVDGGAEVELTLEDRPGSQKITLPRPLAGTDFRFTLRGGVEGTHDADVALSEILLWDEAGPVGILYDWQPEEVGAIHPATVLQDAWLVDRCAGHARGLEIRDGRSFVAVERSGGELTDPVTWVFEGSWAPASGSDSAWFPITLHGRERSGDGIPLLLDADVRVLPERKAPTKRVRRRVHREPEGAPKVSGARVDLALSDWLPPEELQRVLDGWAAEEDDPAACVRDLPLDQLAGESLLVVRGGDVEGLWQRRPLSAVEDEHRYVQVRAASSGGAAMRCSAGAEWAGAWWVPAMDLPTTCIVTAGSLKGAFQADSDVTMRCEPSGAELACAPM